MPHYSNDPTLQPPSFPGSHIVVDGDYVFLSGLTITDIQGGDAVRGDIAEETRWVMRRIAHMLEFVKADIADTVRVDIHLTNLNDIHEMNAVYAEFFPGYRYPARTCTESPRLSGGSNIEITLVARRRQTARPESARRDAEEDDASAGGADE